MACLPDRRVECASWHAGCGGRGAARAATGSHRTLHTPRGHEGSTVAYNRDPRWPTLVGTSAHVALFRSVRWCVRGKGRRRARCSIAAGTDSGVG